MSWILAISPFAVMIVAMVYADRRNWPFHKRLGFTALVTFPYLLIAATLGAYMKAKGWG